MAIIRGSTHKLIYIKEVTFGTTPATPTMLEVPMVQFGKQDAQTVLRSNQIRTHPWTDRMLYGRYMHTTGVDFELQAAVHDGLLETFFGSTISAKALAFADVLKSVSVESQSGSSLFDSFTGNYFDKLSISASASDTSPVKCTLSGMAKAAVLDAGATISTAITAAAFNDPYVFADASLTIAAAATAVLQGNIDIGRQVDPLMLWASRVPREFIAGTATATGKATIPYDAGTQSALVTAFADNAMVFTFANNGATTFRKFTFPKCKIIGISRPVNTRGGIMQDVDWEAYYDTSTTTGVTMTTE